MTSELMTETNIYFCHSETHVAILEVPSTNPNISASFENDLNQQQALENTKKVDAFLS